MEKSCLRGCGSAQIAGTASSLRQFRPSPGMRAAMTRIFHCPNSQAHRPRHSKPRRRNRSRTPHWNPGKALCQYPMKKSNAPDAARLGVRRSTKQTLPGAAMGAVRAVWAHWSSALWDCCAACAGGAQKQQTPSSGYARNAAMNFGCCPKSRKKGYIRRVFFQSAEPAFW